MRKQGATLVPTTPAYTVVNPAPTITNVSVNKPSLWPPNHKMVDVTVNYLAQALCGSVTTSLSIASSEPVNGGGNGNKSADWTVIDNHHVQLRAERSGEGSGRIYTIRITAVDGAGNTSTQMVQVVVPHDQS